VSGSAYDAGFFETYQRTAFQAAQVVLPIVFEVRRPRSVLDVGCGVGAWLRACQEMGVSDLVGVDGSYVPRERLEIPVEMFIDRDLEKPLSLGRRFDLVLSLEVAEHLPASGAPGFVRSLAEHSDLVLFSAAIPGQGGTHHVNEQWQSYWSRCFDQVGFVPLDIVRPRIWYDSRVETYYRQNILLYCRASVRSTLGPPALNAITPESPIDIVHPELFTSAATHPLRLGPAQLVKNLLASGLGHLRHSPRHPAEVGNRPRENR
jgi:SAM-dependent methyltransferase